MQLPCGKQARFSSCSPSRLVDVVSSRSSNCLEPAFKLLDLYDIEEVFVSHSALASYGLTADDLIIDCEVLDDGAMADTLAKCDKVLRF